MEKERKIYKQEGRFGLYQIMFPGEAGGSAMLEYLSVSYGHIWLFAQENYGIAYFLEEKMAEVARVFLTLSKEEFPYDWEIKWQKLNKEITTFARRISLQDLSRLSREEILVQYSRLENLHLQMWQISIFIDAFDPGYDQEEIEKARNAYGFSEEETQVLLLPYKPSFIADWGKALWEYKSNKKTFSDLREDFFWIDTDYTHCNELTSEFVEAETSQAIPLQQNDRESEEKIIKKYHLSRNPLAIFQTLSVWRDERKRLNFIGLYGFCRLIHEMFKRKNIDIALLNSLTLEEVRAFLRGGEIRQALAEKRAEEGFLVHWQEGEKTESFEGEAAQKRKEELENLVRSCLKSDLKGMIACRGLVKGRVRVILDVTKNEEFNEGDILVSAMTRPEFLPLMKKAAAIVTDEGGISCHAAIVARELKKPCIIGTRFATQVLKDGDMVEVDAEKGIVKILKKEKT